jgi:hypothetical protein
LAESCIRDDVRRRSLGLVGWGALWQREYKTG